MKNSTVEAMVRKQFDVSEDVPVKVEFLHFIEKDRAGFCTFRITWWDANVEYVCNCELPFLSASQRSYSEKA